MKTIPLTQGKFALVDDADYKAVSAHKWNAAKVGRRFYAMRRVKKPDGKWATQYLHQFLLPEANRIDHRDGDGLNNQRENLRPATAQQNARGFRRKILGTTSKFRGVSWSKRAGKWKAQIQVCKKVFHLGYFTDEAKAALAYNEAASKYFGDRAHLNIIPYEPKSNS